MMICITTSIAFTYVLSGDTLGDDLGVLVDEHLGLRSCLVDSAGGNAQERTGAVGVQLGS